ncbi:MAG: C39 family peptidase [Candidatus Eisenbacteria bacterium]|nr:C39 family peptidase [Candidatus Eisenbacteria bacterium]
MPGSAQHEPGLKPLSGAHRAAPRPALADPLPALNELPSCPPLGSGNDALADGRGLPPADLNPPEIPAGQMLDIDRETALRVATARAEWEWGAGVRLGSIVPILDARGAVFAWDVDFTIDGSQWGSYVDVASDWQDFCSTRALNAEKRAGRGEAALPREWSSKRYASVTVSATLDAPPIRGSRPGVSSFYATGWIAEETARQALGNADIALEGILFTGTWERMFQFRGGGRTIFVQGHEPWAWFDADEYRSVAGEAEKIRWQRVRDWVGAGGRTAEGVRDSMRAAHAGFLQIWLARGFRDRSPVYIQGYDAEFIPYRWFGGCSPTSGAMVLNYYDELGWYGRITYDYTSKHDPVDGSLKCHVSDAIGYLRTTMHTDSQGYSNGDSIYPGMVEYANGYCGYGFGGGINVLVYFADWHFDEAQAEIDADHPFTWSGNYYPGTDGDGHTVAVVGYDTAPEPDEYLCYNTWARGGTPESAPHSGGLLDGGELVAPHPGGAVVYDVKLTEPDGHQTYNSCTPDGWLYAGRETEIDWINWGTPAHHVDIQYSLDGGDTWNWIASGAPDNGYYIWDVPCDTTSFGRVRLLQYGASGELLSADGSYGEFHIYFPPPPLPPALQSPPNGATCQGLSGVLDWADTDSPAYQVELGTSCPGGSVYTVTSSQYSYSGLTPGTTYFWRVRAQGPCGIWGYQGTCHSFSTGPTPLAPPALSAPANDAVCVSADGDLDWADVPGAAGYRVQMGSTCGGLSPSFDVASSSYHFTGLDAGRTYYWRVKTKDACGNYGDYSTCWRFTRANQVLAAPVLLSPVDGSLIERTSGTLDWADVGGAAGYRVRIGTSCGAGDVYTIDSPTSQYAYSGLANHTTYYWQVATKDDCGQWGAYSSCFHFMTRDPATFTVRPDGGGTYPTIQAAINMALTGDIIELTDGTFTGSGNRDLVWNAKAITIRSQSGNPHTCVIDCQGTSSNPHRGFSFYSLTSSAHLDGVGIINGYETYGGALYVNDASTGPAVNNCWFNLNYCAVGGGAIWCGNGAAPTFNNCDIQGNVSCGSNGGGVYCSGSTPTFNACTIRLNNAILGGGIYSWYATPVLTGTWFQGNSALDAGGGLYITHCSPHPTDCLFSGNTATNSGGGAKCADASNPVFTRCTFSENGAPAGGTLALVSSANISMDHTIVAFAIEGGSVSCDGSSSAGLSCCDVYGNTGGDWIGCIASQSGSNGNFSADPLYCNAALANYALHSDSPCAPTNNPACGQVGALGVECGPSQPATVLIRPNGTGDYPTIQAALDDLPSGSVIELADGVFTGAGNRNLDYHSRTTIVRSQSANAAACIIDCQGSASDPQRAARFDGAVGTPVLQNVTLRNGYMEDAGGAILCVNGASPAISGCVFENNVSDGVGGAIYCDYGSSPQLTACIFQNNFAADWGGAIDMWRYSSPGIHGCRFSGNLSLAGGALDAYFHSAPDVSDCTFEGNEAYEGGAIFCEETQLALNRCTFHANAVPPQSRRDVIPLKEGGVSRDGRALPEVGRATAGGAIYAYVSGVVELSNSIVAFCPSGDAIYCDGGTATLICCDVYGNAWGDWIGCLAGQDQAEGNLHVDPLFCDAEAGVLTLLADSPCAPSSQPSCGQIGSEPVGCGYHIRVEAGGGGDYPTIQAAIDAAGDRDIVDLDDGTYTGTGNRDLDYHGKAITVRSASGDPIACVIDCQGSAGSLHRGFYFHSGEGAASVLEGVTVTAGYTGYGAGVMIAGSSPTLRGCIFRNNHATDTGGGIHTYLGNPMIQECVFEENRADNAAGGLSLNGTTGLVDNCIFRNNWGHWGGGGMYNYSASPTVTGCLFDGNSSDAWGGALHNTQAGSQPHLAHCTFFGNAAPNGGAVYNRADAAVTAENTILSFSSSGGAVYCLSPSAMTLVCSDVYGNVGGDWTGCIAGQAGVNGNFSADPLFCEPAAGDFRLHSDSPCAAENNAGCGLVGALAGQCTASPVDDQGAQLPLAISLGPGIPNPFSTMTSVLLAIPAGEDERVSVQVYDASGRLLRTLCAEALPPGVRRLAWDGTDDTGGLVGSGLYFLRAKTAHVNFTRRIVCVR